MVVKACCLGDGLMATAAIASLAESFAHARVDVLTGPWTRPAYERNPSVARIVDSGSMIGGRSPAPAVLARVVRRLRAANYDGAVVLERSAWLALLPWLAGVPVRAGFDSGRRGATHTRPVPVDGVRHEAERYLDCARAIGAGHLVRRMVFDPGGDARSEAASALREANWQGEPYAVLHPGGGDNPGMRLTSKRWPIASFAELGRRIFASGLRPVVVCGPHEGALGAELAEAVPGSLGLGTRLSLAGVGALAERASVHVGNDSGPTHVALAVGTPTVAVFGPSDERRYGPFGEWPDGSPVGEAVANPPLPPEGDFGRWPSRSTADVTVEAVEAAVDRVMARATSWRRL